MTTTTRRVAGALAAMTAAAAIAPAAAQAATVTASSLGWTSANVYEPAPAGGSTKNRTYLGFATNPTSTGGPPSVGTATASDGATLVGPPGWAAPGTATIDSTSPRGAATAYTFTYPGNAAGRGSVDDATGTADLEFTGKVTFLLYPVLFAPGVPVTVENPRVTLNGTTGAVYASGTGNQGMGSAPYTRATPVFTLDLSNAIVVDHVDGSHSITNIVPTVAGTQVFGASYAAGVAGPDRSPNTFGSFSVRVAYPADPIPAVAGPKGDTGATGPQGPKGDTGVAGASSGTRSYVLAKAPFGSKTVTVTVLTKKGYALTVGAVKGKTLKVKRSLSKGTYTLQRTNRFVKQRTASIKVG